MSKDCLDCKWGDFNHPKQDRARKLFGDWTNFGICTWPKQPQPDCIGESARECRNISDNPDFGLYASCKTWQSKGTETEAIPQEADR